MTFPQQNAAAVPGNVSSFATVEAAATPSAVAETTATNATSVRVEEFYRYEDRSAMEESKKDDDGTTLSQPETLSITGERKALATTTVRSSITRIPTLRLQNLRQFFALDALDKSIFATSLQRGCPR